MLSILPTDLVKLIISYIDNSHLFSILHNIIIEFNHFYVLYYDDFEIVRTQFNIFNINEHYYNPNSATVMVEIKREGGHSYIKLKIININNVDYHFILNFIMAHLAIVGYDNNRVSNQHLLEQVMYINQILEKYRFNNFLVPLYIKDNIDALQILIQWSSILTKNR